jgi:hypothetical protein
MNNGYTTGLSAQFCWAFSLPRSKLKNSKNLDVWRLGLFPPSGKTQNRGRGRRFPAVMRYNCTISYGLDDRGSRVRFPAGAGNFSLHHGVQNGFGAHPASYPMGTSGSFPGDKAAGT